MDPTQFDLPPLTRRHSAADECSDLLQPAPLQNMYFYLKATDSGQRLCLCKEQSLVFITVIPQSIFHLDLLAAIVQSSRQPLESQFDPDTDLSTTAGCINKADVEASRGNTRHRGNRLYHDTGASPPVNAVCSLSFYLSSHHSPSSPFL